MVGEAQSYEITSILVVWCFEQDQKQKLDLAAELVLVGATRGLCVA